MFVAGSSCQHCRGIAKVGLEPTHLSVLDFESACVSPVSCIGSTAYVSSQFTLRPPLCRNSPRSCNDPPRRNKDRYRVSAGRSAGDVMTAERRCEPGEPRLASFRIALSITASLRKPIHRLRGGDYCRWHFLRAGNRWQPLAASGPASVRD